VLTLGCGGLRASPWAAIYRPARAQRYRAVVGSVEGTTPKANTQQPGAAAAPQPFLQRSERRRAPGSAGTGRWSGDLTPLPDLQQAHSRTGPVRQERPVYVDLLPPCNSACPAGENIQGWLAQMNAGNHEQAWRVLVADNPFPAIHGRVC